VAISSVQPYERSISVGDLGLGDHIFPSFLDDGLGSEHPFLLLDVAHRKLNLLHG